MVAVIDAKGAVLGRLCTHVAKRLLEGEQIVIVNSEKAIISGKADMIKKRYRFKREVGTYRKGPFYPRMPDQIVKRTVRGMIPYQSSHGREAFKRLKCFIGVPSEFAKASFETVESAMKSPVKFMTVAQVSRELGADV